MRKIILVSLLVGLMVFGSFAQMNDMSFGIKGGLTLGSTTEDMGSEVDKKFRMGFAFGGMMVMPLNENMALQSELLYVMKGQKYEFLSEDYTLKVAVLEIPVLLKYMINETMAVYGGPTLDYLLSAKYDDEDAKDYFKDMFFGLSLGAQYKMDQIIFDARYDLGLTKVDDTGSSDAKLNTMYVTVGYLF